MATNTAGTTARHYNRHMVHYFRKKITKADATLVVPLGIIPAGSIVIRGGVAVREAFNAGTNNRLNIGTVADDDGFATLLALGTVGVIVADEMATSDDFYVSVDTLVNCTVDVTGTAATTGIAEVWIEFLIQDGLVNT